MSDELSTAEDAFKAAEASSSYTVKCQKTGFQLQHDGRAAGGWNSKNRHWFILNRFASEYPRHKELLVQCGFEPKEQPAGHKWWKLSSEAEVPSFCRALAALTGTPIA